MLIYTVVCFFFNLANLFVNWKLYETISNHNHEEARKWLKMQITLVAIYLVANFIFLAALGFGGEQIFGLIIDVAIYGLWFYYVDNFIKLECYLEEKHVEIPVW